MLNLNTCVKGQQLLLRNGKIAEYKGRQYWGDTQFIHEAVVRSECFSLFMDCGANYANEKDDQDVIEILPLETTDKHPSIAWWESCPWITNRKPTEEDGDKFGRVHVKGSGTSMILVSNWDGIGDGESWIHIWHWKPPFQ